MVKTLLVNNLTGDLKDNTGGFNAGRPSGYVEDFKSLPKDTQELMRHTKRTKVVFGTVVMDGAMDENGNPVTDEAFTQEIPFVMDIKSRGSVKAIDDAVKAIQRKNALPLQYYLVLDAELHSMPSGNEYATVLPKLGDKVELAGSDKDVLDGFMDWIAGMNGYINDQHEERSGGTMSAKAEEVINDIIDVEVAD
jgi:hypothetical protein